MLRRTLLSRLAFLPALAGLAAGARAASPARPLKIMFKSAWGSDDPTKAAFPFLHAHALAEAGHSVQIFLLGEAVSLMRSAVANAVVPVGWPPLVEGLEHARAPRRHGGGSRRVGREVRQCGDIRRSRGMGRPDHY